MNDVKIKKHFNTEGACFPPEHYMVNLESRLKEIKKLIDARKYFTITKARQYGKTTTLVALADFISDEYIVFSLDFQEYSTEDFKNEQVFSSVFAENILNIYTDVVSSVHDELMTFIGSENPRLSRLFQILSRLCEKARKPIVLLIDEVDNASNNQVFLDFLSKLRSYYLKRGMRATFHSVILTGVYDIKNLKIKIHPGEPSRQNIPWNIAARFDIAMNFSVADIAGMLEEYEKDYQTRMNISEISNLIYDYTSGYPILTSLICQYLDEIIAETAKFPTKEAAWTKEGVLHAVKLIVEDQNTLFDSLIQKITDFEAIGNMIKSLLFQGQNIPYNPDEQLIHTIIMFGFAKKSDNNLVVISNRIFEIRLYNYYIAKELTTNRISYNVAENYKTQFIHNGELHMERILEKFVQHFNDIYGNKSQAFKEEEGRKYFLLYLKPIINGVGNYYIEAQTRDMRRTDIIIDYLGKQYIVEMKIWHGEEYNTREEQQLTEYLDYYHLEKGYLLSFNFNQQKEVGVKHIAVGDKILVEAVV